MAIKNNNGITFFLITLLLGGAYVYPQERRGLPFKPLCAPTPFSRVLDYTMHVWSAIIQGGEGHKQHDLRLSLLALGIMVQLLDRQNQRVHPGNIEYLLSVFDAMEHHASMKLVSLIEVVKKSLIDLL